VALGCWQCIFFGPLCLFLLRCVSESVSVSVCVLFLLSVLVCCGVIDYSAIDL
jgi:hypothetical protein